MLCYKIAKNSGNIAENMNNYYYKEDTLERIIEKIQVYFERFSKEEFPESIRYKIHDLAIEAISYKDCNHEQLQYLYIILGDVSYSFKERLQYYKKSIQEVKGNEVSKLLYKEYFKTLFLYFLQNLGNIFR